ncbi:hypothetical protein FVEN_g13180 [Fusarium venenatum]|nr:hypothetical protein FVEN_g13180 [Fusarium venenatum]
MLSRASSLTTLLAKANGALARSYTPTTDALSTINHATTARDVLSMSPDTKPGIFFSL